MNYMRDRNMQHGGPKVPIVSLGLVPETVSLQSLFNLLEVWGTVIFIKRNYNKPKVVTVKFVSLSDAENCVHNMKKVHIDDGDEHVSARLFGHFNDATFQEPADEGDPNDATTCLGYNFSSATHRSSAQRCRNAPSEILKLINVGPETTPESITGQFLHLDLPVPTAVTPQIEATADGENAETPATSSYLLNFPGSVEAIKAVMEATGKISGQLIFAPSAQPAVSEGAGADFSASATPNLMNGGENGDAEAAAASEAAEPNGESM